MIERVFYKGQDANGGKIGDYSTTPTYVSIQGAKNKYGSQIRSSSLKARGKNSNDDKFKNGKLRKSQYFAGGYREFREAVGRQGANVDLFLTGSTLRSIQVGIAEGRAQLAFNNEALAERASFNETKFNKEIFAPSDTELAKFEQSVEEEITNAFFSAFE